MSMKSKPNKFQYQGKMYHFSLVIICAFLCEWKNLKEKIFGAIYQLFLKCSKQRIFFESLFFISFKGLAI